METATSSKSSTRLVQKRATELLDWLIDFLPGATPPSAKDAILDVAEDVDALFYHRSELQKVLETTPEALNQTQKEKLAKLDCDIRSAALLLFGAIKGALLRRYREGRYDRSHWWWYIDDLVRETNFVEKNVATNGEDVISAKQRATELLEWLNAFLPTAIPSSPEQAILDDSGDVNALLWHRSELENILQKTPSALAVSQKQQLIALDIQIRQSALLIVGAEKGELRRFRKGHYDRSHWWWYLDDILIEESFSNPDVKLGGKFAIWEEIDGLPKLADRKAVYERKSRIQQRVK